MSALKEYSVEEKLVGLIKLQKVDTQLDQIKILRGELPIEVSDLADEVQGLHARKTRIEEEINGITEFVESKRQVIRDGEAGLAKYEKQSDNVKNSREFEALNKEIEMMQLDIKLAEKHIKDANEELVQKAKELDAAKKQISAKDSVLTSKKSELEKIIAETEKEEKVLKQLSDEARKDVEDRLLYSYDRIRKNYRNGLSVVPVERDACGGCYNAIPPQRQSEIRLHKKLVVCENCGRILVDSDLNDSVEVKA